MAYRLKSKVRTQEQVMKVQSDTKQQKTERKTLLFCLHPFVRYSFVLLLFCLAFLSLTPAECFDGQFLAIFDTQCTLSLYLGFELSTLPSDPRS